MKPSYQRLESLDVLRGFDLFCLVALEGVLHPLGRAIDAPWYNDFLWCFSHVQWEGFSSWDLVMPLFMFMAGVSMPFALSRYKVMPDKWAVYRRIVKRVALLWIFGMMCQGNLLGLDPDRIYLYSNTLQAIAMGYLISAMLFLHVRLSVQIGTAVALLLAYWGAMQFITVDGYGGGNYTPDGNLAEWVDRTVLGRFRDAAVVENGQIVFAESYRYTWILSSLNFGGADRSFCRAYLEERNGPEAQMAMAVRNRCDNGCAGLAVGLAVAGDQEDMDELDGVGQQWLLFPVDGLVLLLDRL